MERQRRWGGGRQGRGGGGDRQGGPYVGRRMECPQALQGSGAVSSVCAECVCKTGAVRS